MLARVESSDDTHVCLRLLEYQKDVLAPTFEWTVRWKVMELSYWHPVGDIRTRTKTERSRVQIKWGEAVEVVPVLRTHVATQVKKGEAFPGKIVPFDTSIKFIGSDRCDVDFTDVIGMLVYDEIVFFVREGDWHIECPMGEQFICPAHLFEERYSASNLVGLENEFVRAFKVVQSAAHLNSRRKGFWDTEINDAEKLALMHSELSECLEGVRKGNPPSEHIPEFSASEEELADLVIRVMDYAQGRGLRVAEAIQAKMKFNSTRPKLHGKLF